MPTHVCLVGRQPLPNLLGALTLHPSHVVLLTTDGEDRVRERLETMFGKHGVRTSWKRVRPYDLETVWAACEAVLADPPSLPVMLNATGGTKVAALAAVSAFQQHDGAEIFYVNTDERRIQWLGPVGREDTPLEVPLKIEDYLKVHGLAVTREEPRPDIQVRRKLSARIAGHAFRTEPLMSYFRKVYYRVDKKGRSLEDAVADCEPDFPRDLGPAQRDVLDAIADSGMIVRGGDRVVRLRSVKDLQYLGGGRWLEEYTYLTLRDLKPDDLRANLVVRWGRQGTEGEVENELDVVAAHYARLFVFSCKTGGAVGSLRKDGIAQDEVFKLEALRDLAGGTFARAVLVAGSRMTPRIKARCGTLGIGYVDVDNLHRLGEQARALMGL